MSAPNITRVVKKLEASNLVKRTRAMTSDREVLARLTREGERVFTESYPVIVESVRDFFDAHLEADEQEQLIALLQKLLDCPREKPMLAALLEIVREPFLFNKSGGSRIYIRLRRMGLAA
ncbi:MAG: hypothetical protein GY822_06660 [Deltaproteobacteria bacterium]|nr:hypothetical protein [Deltaproteobacteria bacterium]